MELWNIRTQKRVYAYTSWGAGVTALEQSPAVDVVGVGLSDGRIVLHNLKFDETLITFNQGQVRCAVQCDMCSMQCTVLRSAVQFAALRVSF